MAPHPESSEDGPESMLVVASFTFMFAADHLPEEIINAKRAFGVCVGVAPEMKTITVQPDDAMHDAFHLMDLHLHYVPDFG